MEDGDAANSVMASSSTSCRSSPAKPARRIVRRNKASSSGPGGGLPPHIVNNQQLQHAIRSTLPADYEFEIPKTIDRIEKSGAVKVALQLPEGLLMYATCIGDILKKFAYASSDSDSGRPKPCVDISVLGDVTYGACCIDDLTAQALACDLLVHYGHSCLVPTTLTAVPCLYVFVEIRVDVRHLVDCVRLTFLKEATEGREGDAGQDGKLVELAVMGTVQFRSAVLEAAALLNQRDHPRFGSAIPSHCATSQALSPGEVLGCTAPAGLANLNWSDAVLSARDRRAQKNAQPAHAPSQNHVSPQTTERVMIFVADGRFHLEAAMISNPSLRALRYDPYSKTLTEERYEIGNMKRLRREAVQRVREMLGVTYCRNFRHGKDIANGLGSCANNFRNSEDIANNLLQTSQNQQSHTHTTPTSSPIAPSSPCALPSNPQTMGIILGTLGRQGNPGILARIRSLLRSRGIRVIIVLLSEIFPKKLQMLSGEKGGGPSGAASGVCAWVQIACPRLSIDWGHYFCVPVLSPFELFVALGEVPDSNLWSDNNKEDGTNASNEQSNGFEGDYPMDFYSKNGGPWTNYYESNNDRRALSCGIQKV
eukprot:CCRYP_006922-RD/>CCRYP_006922-RD protein AED:0.20 eAED:0.20 QI:0/0.8/0.66/1/0.4/0.33/6/385/593